MGDATAGDAVALCRPAGRQLGAVQGKSHLVS
jgi:hypothetical protein